MSEKERGMTDTREAWCAATMFSGSLCTRPAGHEGHHFHRDPWAEGSPDPREALVALLHNEGDGGIWEHFDRKNSEAVADAILAAFDVTPRGERVKPSVEDVAAAIEAETASYDPVTSPERGEPESL